jgi:hypothetical protein
LESISCGQIASPTVEDELEIRNLQNTPMSIRTTTTGQEMRKTIPKPNPNLNRVSMIWAATRSNMSKYGAIPTRKAAPLIKRKNLPTFCTVVSGFWFTSAICANPEYQLSASPSGFMEFTPPQDPQSPPDQRRSRSRHEHHRPMATMLREGERRNYATREVRLGELFVECAENTEFPGFGFLRQAETAPWGGKNSSQGGKPEPEGSKEGDWMYTGMVPGAKMEIPAKLRLRAFCIGPKAAVINATQSRYEARP